MWISLALRFLPYIFGLVFVTTVTGVGLYKARHWCNTVCKTQTERADKAEGLLADARKRATDLALLWAAEVDKTEAKNLEAERERAGRFAALADRARHLPARPPVPVSPELDRVWRDSASQANAARPAAVDQAATPTVSAPAYSEQALAEWFVASAAAYADAYGQWQACVNHYNSLREKQ